ncbi:MAG TPA: hypothetical protein VGY30_02035 [Solirubrobacteraceae bacterium]|nr:hypothetical protein [Solirubrobacteraceae bacterium]
MIATLAALSIACCLVGWTAVQGAAGYGVPLQTGISEEPTGPEMDQSLTHARATGAQFQRLTFSWRAIAPAKRTREFDPANPFDPAYRWQRVDRAIAATFAHGLTPFISINEPPSWGQSPEGAGEEQPDPTQLALFAQAFATRYDGSQPGLPWVRYWEVWNEPNSTFFLLPQIQNGRAVSIDNYRTLLNASSAAIHQANPSNVVIGGALFPNGQHHATVTTIAPLEFTRRLFCLSGGAHPHRVCNASVNADVWSVHPYTSGGPSTLPLNPANIWIANLAVLSRIVRAAQRVGTLVAPQPVQMWVTEFSWGSSPLAPRGVPLSLERRWVAETLYRAWSAGVSQFSWYELQDEARLDNLNPYGGLYFECTRGIYCARPKPATEAFRFPFVAYASSKRRMLVWGRTPAGAVGTVRVEWRQGGRWRSLAKLRTDGDGIFTARLSLPRGADPSSALLRAVLLGDPAISPPFSLHRTPDIAVTPFGT